MGENANNTGDVEMSKSEMIFENLTILKELSNITNLVSDEEFLETVPKHKPSHKRVMWVPMFHCLKQSMLDEMVQELSAMWQCEGMPRKMEVLEKQKEKFAGQNIEKPLWRPQLGDVASQLRAAEALSLQKQKVQLECLAQEYEARVGSLKKVITAKRGYLKALQTDLANYQKKYEDLILHMNKKIINRKNLIETIKPTLNIDEMNWSDTTYSDANNANKYGRN